MKLQTVNHLLSTIKKIWEKKIQPNPLHSRMAKMMVILVILFGGIFGYKFIKVLMMARPMPPPI